MTQNPLKKCDVFKKKWFISDKVVHPTVYAFVATANRQFDNKLGFRQNVGKNVLNICNKFNNDLAVFNRLITNIKRGGIFEC